MKPLALPQAPLPSVPPLHPVTRAVLRSSKALSVLALCALINTLTSPGLWWFQWVALGLGIAMLASWAQALGRCVTPKLVAELERRLQRPQGGDPR